jgi:predicted Zn-dependent peptidase
MSGKTGRLYKKLVEEKGIAKSSAEGGRRMMPGDNLSISASQDSKKYAGAFQMAAEGMADIQAEQLEEAMYEVIEELKNDPVPQDELQKVKNQLRVKQIRFMDIMSGLGILFVLGQNTAYGDWTEANNNPKMCDMVTVEDIQRVANEYFAKDQRNVLLINSTSKSGSDGESGEDPRFTQMAEMIKGMTDAARLEQMMGMVSMQLDQIEDPKEKENMEKLLKIAGERVKELKASEGN